MMYRNLFCDIASTPYQLPDYHEATKIPDIVQDRYNDDIYQNICCSQTVIDGTSSYRLEGVDVISIIDRRNGILRWHVCRRDIAFRSAPVLSALGIVYDGQSSLFEPDTPIHESDVMTEKTVLSSRHKLRHSHFLVLDSQEATKLKKLAKVVARYVEMDQFSDF